MNYVKYIDAEKWTDIVGSMKNVQLFPFFDCCREKKQTKGMTSTSGESVSIKGTNCTFFAKKDGELANAGKSTDMLSPTTRAFIYFMKANPGASYPNIL